MDNRTVFDVNIWISYFLKGKFTELVDLMANHDVEFFRAKELTHELISVISRDKFKKYLHLPLQSYISFYEKISTFLTIQNEFSSCRDPKDNYLFDLAFQSHSKYLVSGDRDVRETVINRPLNVVSLRTFKEMISE